MNRTYTLLAIAALCCAIVAWQIWQQEQRHTPAPVTAAETSAPAAQFLEEPSVGAHSPIPLPGEPGDQNAVPANGENPDSDTEVVLGLRVRKDRNCTLSVRQYADPETAELRNVYSCTPNEPVEPDPYESWSEEVLASMAYGDAHAAQVLGLRHISSDNAEQEALGLSLLYRSVALSGDPTTFRKAIGQRYAYLEINGEPQIHNMKQLLVFNIIGEAMGDNRFNTAQVLLELKRADVPAAELERLQTGAWGILEAMADLQVEMTGDTTIREALVNA